MRTPLAGAAIAFVLGVALAIVVSPRADGPDLVEEDVLAAALPERADGAPDWQVGEAWRVQFGSGDPDCWVVVATADEEGYRQGFSCSRDDEEDAIVSFATAFEYRYVGNVSRELGGRASMETVELYRWPLEDGASWPTTWFGRPVTIEAELDEGYEGANGPEARYVLQMVEDDEVIITYDYVPSLRWFSIFYYVESEFAFRVHEHAPRWAGDAVAVGHGERLVEVEAPLATQTALDSTFEVPEHVDLLVPYALRQGAHLERLILTGPDGEERWTPGVGGLSTGVSVAGASSHIDLLEAEPGTWGIDHAGFATGMLELVVFGIDVQRVRAEAVP